MGNFCKVTDVWQKLPYFIRLACHTLFSGNTLSAFLSAILTDQRDLNFPENTPFYNGQESCKVRANETCTHVENISLHNFIGVYFRIPQNEIYDKVSRNIIIQKTLKSVGSTWRLLYSLLSEQCYFYQTHCDSWGSVAYWGFEQGILCVS